MQPQNTNTNDQILAKYTALRSADVATDSRMGPAFILTTKPGCYFCHAMKKELDKLGIGYILNEDKNAEIAPVLLDVNTEEQIFVGIPPKNELYDYLSGAGYDCRKDL